MPVDLDEMFADLSRDGDTVPVAPAVAARRRGARRTRNRAVAAALATLLAIAGVGVAAWQRGHRAEPILPATPNSPIRGLEPLGEPLDLGGDRYWSYPAVSEGRVYAVSMPMAAGGDARRNRGVAVAGRTGDILWSTLEDLGDTDIPVPIPGTVLLREAAPQPIMHLLDPATGAERWSLVHELDDDLVFHTDVLVRVHAADGLTEGFDIRTGERLWSAPGGADRPRFNAGIPGGNDVRRWGLSNNEPFSDGYMFQQLTSGRMLIRDVRTGAVRNRIATVLNSQSGLTTVHDGTVFWPVGDEIRAAALGDDSTARVIFTFGPGKGPRGLFGCGAGRVCVGEAADDDEKDSRVVAVDVDAARTLWTAPASFMSRGTARAGRILTGSGRGAALRDDAGRVLYEGPGDIGWIDDGNMLQFQMRPDGKRTTVAVVSAVDGARTVLGEFPSGSSAMGPAGHCAWSAETLACVDGSRLVRYRFTR
ncbi:PQQ-binding-like beta-propeller repeat protein [Actinoplanes sp. NPDC023714]|uniref:outer membrane protein assembly factor BamB family protein n=1 Tax=Actinoplanes sp. NPDC023714 TaxID=3154322 RepID=UPI003401E65B